MPCTSHVQYLNTSYGHSLNIVSLFYSCRMKGADLCQLCHTGLTRLFDYNKQIPLFLQFDVNDFSNVPHYGISNSSESTVQPQINSENKLFIFFPGHCLARTFESSKFSHPFLRTLQPPHEFLLILRLVVLSMSVKAALRWSHVFNHLLNFSETLRIDFKNSNNSLKRNLTAVFAAECKLYGVEMRR